MIELKGKAKKIVPVSVVCTAIAFGLVLDHVHENRFRVEKLKPDEVNEYAAALETAEPIRASGEKININTAAAEELTELDGVGKGIAENIVEYRETNGGFISIEELLNVDGIGESKLETIRDEICIEDE